MGRPQKQTVDYFPHYVIGSRRTISILENRWGNDGYAFWFKLLELLCITDGHSFNLSTVPNQEYLYSFTKTEAETAEKIIEKLVDLENIDRELWEKHRIIWCQSLVDNLKGLYDKRTTSIPLKPFFEENIPENPPKEEKTEQSDPETPETPPPTPKRGKGRPKKDKSEEPQKKSYADNVTMTEEEYNKLVAKYGAADTQRMIDKLDNAKGAKGYKYKSDYRAILNWVVEEVLGKTGGTNGYGRNETPTTATAGGFKPSGGFKK